MSFRRRGFVWRAVLTLLLVYILGCCLYAGLPRLSSHEESISLPDWMTVDEVIRGEWRLDSGPVLYYPKSCQPRRNLAFIKCMKCATETLGTVLRRYAYVNDLSVVLPVERRIYLGWPYPLSPLDYRPSSRGYNFLVEHAVYNATGMRQLMNADTAFVTVIREPMDMFVSLLNYFNVFEIANVTVRHGMEAVQTYLRDIRHYEAVYKSQAASPKRYCIPDGFSITKNLLAHCLGVPLGFPEGRTDISEDPNAVRQYVEQLDSEFGLVMLMEYLDESLVLLRRLMCWDVKDMIYHAINRGAYRRNVSWSLLTPGDRRIHKLWSAVDYTLYDHFNRTFWSKVAEQGESFYSEVDFLRRVQKQVTWFCGKVTPYGRSFIRFPESPWSLAFTFSSEDCELMTGSLLEMLKARYPKHEPRFANFTSSKDNRKFSPLC